MGSGVLSKTRFLRLRQLLPPLKHRNRLQRQLRFLCGMRNFTPIALLLVLAACLSSVRADSQAPWTCEQATRWYGKQPWIVGANYIPSTAVNQLEMWQASTFDPVTIDRELGWAQTLGFTTSRVFLHSVAWRSDPAGFLGRVDQFLGIAHKHGIRPIFVFFDDCWNPSPVAGPQPAPRPGVHNSGWVQDPGWPASKDESLFPVLHAYVAAVLERFGHDDRVLMWDLYNEPGNSKKGLASLPLLQAVFAWAREAGPDQPITSGIWDLSLEALNTFQATHSDIITYHNYSPRDNHRTEIEYLKLSGRPLVCTEYMARPRESRFGTILPLLKDEHVGAVNWGFVSGKTNTIYAWDTPIPDGSEPKEWFHDIFRGDGTPYRADEVAVIRRLTTTP